MQAEVDNIIVINNLIKHFGEVRAVNGVDLDVARGKVVVIIGPRWIGQIDGVALHQSSGIAHQWRDLG